MKELRSKHGHFLYALTEIGIYGENGFLFHHGFPREMTDFHKDRLKQHGIIIEGKSAIQKKNAPCLRTIGNLFGKITD
ncbi:unnamed protein product, partial [Mesorhabditis belari]|uniref:Uncharacterized protein n=1 Tax=Mesorhabditis belari TaxID=2138241 RepID=A0AAF3FST0_9BILA